MATYKGKKVTLYKPRKMAGITPAAKKKSVFVPGKKPGTAKVVHFGDSSMSDFTKHKDPKRRASFRARHKCDTAKDKSTARFWSCSALWNLMLLGVLNYV
jgi:hypothetical protein